MKTDWTNAPEWAEYRAKDDNGKWHWFEKEPQLLLPDRINHWNEWLTDGMTQEIEIIDQTYWTKTLEKRPSDLPALLARCKPWIELSHDSVSRTISNRIMSSDELRDCVADLSELDTLLTDLAKAGVK